MKKFDLLHKPIEKSSQKLENQKKTPEKFLPWNGRFSMERLNRWFADGCGHEKTVCFLKFKGKHYSLPGILPQMQDQPLPQKDFLYCMQGNIVLKI